MEKPTVAPNDPVDLPDEAADGEEQQPMKAGEAKPAAKRARASKSGTKKATAKKASAKKTTPRTAPVEPVAAAEAPAEATPAGTISADSAPVEPVAAAAPSTANTGAGAAEASGMAWPLHGVSETTGYLAAAAASKAGIPVDAWVDQTLAEAANRTLNPKSSAFSTAEDLLPSIGELSQKLEVLRHAIGNEDSPVAKLAGQLKGSADEMAASLGQRFKTAAEKAPPLDEVTARLKQTVRYAREHAALDEVASKWREHVDKSKWREHVRQARQVAGGVIGDVKGKAEDAIEDLWNRQSRDAESPEQSDERRDGTGSAGQ